MGRKLETAFETVLQAGVNSLGSAFARKGEPAKAVDRQPSEFVDRAVHREGMTLNKSVR